MAKIFLYSILVLIGVVGIVLIANSQNKTKSLQDVVSNLPATPVLQQQTQEQNNPPQQPQQQTTPKATESPSTVASSDAATQTASKSAVIKTAKGDITVSFYTSDAPQAVANFINKAQSGFYNNLTFHRVEDWVVQGGDPNGNGSGGGSMPVEFNSKPFVVGSLGMASKGDGKTQNDSQFFITKQEASWLNGKYTNFGIVTSGMDVVNKMAIGDKILEIKIQ